MFNDDNLSAGERRLWSNTFGFPEGRTALGCTCDPRVESATNDFDRDGNRVAIWIFHADGCESASDGREWERLEAAC